MPTRLGGTSALIEWSVGCSHCLPPCRKGPNAAFDGRRKVSAFPPAIRAKQTFGGEAEQPDPRHRVIWDPCDALNKAPKSIRCFRPRPLWDVFEDGRRRYGVPAAAERWRMKECVAAA